MSVAPLIYDFDFMPEGFEIEREVGRGAHSIVYRAKKDGRVYALKLLRESGSTLSREAALRFRREAALLACLRHPGIPEILSVIDAGGRPFLVMEYVEGSPLSQEIEKGPFSEAALANLAEQCASILHEVHRHNLVHRDIKPLNILLDEHGRYRLIDFGLAIRSRGEAADHIAGSFVYSAPEQTQRLNLPVDERSDLYALGVVLFECATGHPPFYSVDPGELITLHLSKEAPDLRELRPDLSPALCALIGRLLKKDPSDRFQNAQSLSLALTRLKELNEEYAKSQHLTLTLFSTGADELPLAGRREELLQLTEAFSRSKAGHPMPVLIAGAPGSGKSRLVREFFKTVRSNQGSVISTKCTVDNPMPFSAIKGLMESFTTQLRALPEPNLSAAKGKLVKVIGEWRPLLKSFVPSLYDSIRPEAPARDEKAPQLEKEQYLEAIAEVLSGFARVLSPLCLFVDDMQWLDDESSAVLERLLSQSRNTFYFFLGTRRDDDIKTDATSPLLKKADRFLEIKLGALNEDAIAEIIRSHLGGLPLDGNIVTQIAHRSQSNPFAVQEYVRALLDSGSLLPYWGVWRMENEQLEKLNLPGDVIQLVLRRLQDLSPHSRKLLGIASLIGSEFGQKLLASALKQEERALLGSLGEARSLHLIEATGVGMYGFVHDRVQEALLASIPSEELRDHHESIALALDKISDPSAEEIYSRARHHNLGYPDRNPETTFRANERAGRLALADCANDLALEFLERAEPYSKSLSDFSPGHFYETLGEAYSRVMRTSESIRCFTACLNETRSRLERARLHVRIAEVYLSKYDGKNIWASSRAALRELGTSFHSHSPLNILLSLRDWGIGLIVGAIPFLYGSARGKRKQRFKILASIYHVATHASYFEMDALSWIQLAGRSLRAANWVGDSVELVEAYSTYGTAMATLGLTGIARRYTERAISVAKTLGDRKCLARALAWRCLTTSTADPRLSAAQNAIPVVEQQTRWLSTTDYLTITADMGWHLAIRGYANKSHYWLTYPVATTHPESPTLLEKLEHPFRQIDLLPLGALGKFEEGMDLSRFGESTLQKYPTDHFRAYAHLSCLLFLSLERGATSRELDEIIERCREITVPLLLTLPHFIQFYVYQAQARLIQFQSSTGEERKKRKRQLDHALNQLKWVGHRSIFRTHYWVLRAAVERHNGHLTRALQFVSHAERHAENAESVWGRFEVACERARLYALGERPTAAAAEARFAYQLALEQEWMPRAKRVKEEFHVETSPSPSYSISRSLSLDSKTINPQALLLKRHLDVLLQVSQATSRIFDPEEQARAILDETIRVLAAERAALFICQDSAPEPQLKRARSRDGKDLPELSGYSRTVVSRVCLERRPLVVSSTEEGAEMGSESVVAHDLRSLMAAPVLHQNKLLGVVYLDSHLARGVFTSEDAEILMAITNHIAIAFETAKSAAVEVERRAYQKDLEVTGAVQKLFLPRQRALSTKALSLSAFHQSAAQAGGDWFWYYENAEGKLVVLMADVTGHGAGAAMVTAAVASTYATYEKQREGRGIEVPVALNLINAAVARFCEGEYWVAFSALEIDPLSGKFRWWNAGVPPLLRLRSKDSVETIVSRGMPLGSGPLNVGEVSGDLKRGERLLLFTDGVEEMVLPSQRELGLRKLKKLLCETYSQTTLQGTAHLESRLKELRGSVSLRDDMSFVLIDHKEDS